MAVGARVVHRHPMTPGSRQQLSTVRLDRRGPRQPDATLAATLRRQRSLPAKLAGVSLAGISFITAAAYASPHRQAVHSVAPVSIAASSATPVRGGSVGFTVSGAPRDAAIALSCSQGAQVVLTTTVPSVAATVSLVGPSWTTGAAECRAQVISAQGLGLATTSFSALG